MLLGPEKVLQAEACGFLQESSWGMIILYIENMFLVLQF
jgi:hypothetical protein